MLFVCCQLLEYSRGVSWNWRCAFDQSIGSHRVTWECNNPLKRFCCISPGNHSWHKLIRFVCPWSHIWTLVMKNWLILSLKEDAKDSGGFHWLGMDRTHPLLSHRSNGGAAQPVGQSFLHQESLPMSKSDPCPEGSFCSSSSRDDN